MGGKGLGITGSTVGDVVLIAGLAAATGGLGLAAAPALAGAAGAGAAGGAAAGAGAGLGAGLGGATAAEMGALGLTGAEIAAATPAMGATAGAGLPIGATIAAMPEAIGSVPTFAGFEGVPAQNQTWLHGITQGRAADWIPSSAKGALENTTMVGVGGQALKGLLFPQRPSVPAPGAPSVSRGGGGYRPTSDNQLAMLANLIAQRRAQTAQRRFV